MICINTNLKASLWLSLGIYLKFKSEIHVKTAMLYKKDVAFKKPRWKNERWRPANGVNTNKL